MLGGRRRDRRRYKGYKCLVCHSGLFGCGLVTCRSQRSKKLVKVYPQPKCVLCDMASAAPATSLPSTTLPTTSTSTTTIGPQTQAQAAATAAVTAVPPAVASAAAGAKHTPTSSLPREQLLGRAVAITRTDGGTASGFLASVDPESGSCVLLKVCVLTLVCGSPIAHARFAREHAGDRRR